MESKLDFKKEYKSLYTAGTKPAIVKIPPMKYLCVSGQGAPASDEFQHAMQALYPVAYTLKFSFRKGDKPAGYRDYTIPPLETLWWMDQLPFDASRKDLWKWTAMVAQPSFITAAMVKKATREVQDKKGISLPVVKLEKINEGNCVQVMHTGPYDEVSKAISLLEQFAAENNYKLKGKHHEIYLNDPRRNSPAKLKTIVRYAIEKK